MVNRSKAKGTGAETDVADCLKANGYPRVERRTLAGASDKGDIAGVPGVVIEVKNEKSMTLASYVDEATREAVNAGEPIGVAWHKRRGRGSPAEWYVSMTGETFLRLLAFAHAGGLA